MSVRLGEFLIEKTLLTQTQLEEALQAQVIFGGKLGTILIEMGLISENKLAGIMPQLLSIPCAEPGQLQHIPENIIKIISSELAEQYKVVPVAVSGKKLTLAMAEPQNLKMIDEISFRTGYVIQPILALEVRLVFALEKYYNVKRTMRYITPQKDQQHVFHTPDGSIESSETDTDLGEPDSELVHQKFTAQKKKGVEIEEIEVIEELTDEDRVKDEEITLATTAQALINITDRDDVADAVIAYLGAHYARAVLFMVVAGQVSGWRSVKNGQPLAAFDQFQLPLAEPSVLKTAVESNSYFLGPIPQGGANLVLTAFLGKPAPESVLLVPMSMLGRVVGLIYVDDAQVNLSTAVVDVQQLSSKALMAFELLILHNKILRT